MGKRSTFLSLLAPTTVFLFAVFAGYIIHRASWFNQDKHFALLAHSFLRNDLFLNPINLPSGDYVDFFAKQYLFFGPLPSILLMPFVAIWGKFFPQIFLSFVSLAVVYLSVFKLCTKFKFSKPDSMWLANFFVFGTVYYFVSLINISAYVVQAVGTAFLFLSILEYFTKRRFLVIGVLIAAAGSTRITLFGITIFFVLEIIRIYKKNLLKPLIYLLIPILITMAFLGIYNYKRFNSIFDTGYTRNVSVLNKDYYNYLYGWFGKIHIPANLYSLLFMGPEPVRYGDVELVLEFPYLKANGFGMAIWLTSPLFVYLIRAKREPHTISASIGIFVLLFPSLIYMGIGASQYGYRYSLDFLPLLFLILISAFKKGLPEGAKVLIAAGIVFNCFYMLSIWNSYPLLDWFEYIN